MMVADRQSAETIEGDSPIAFLMPLRTVRESWGDPQSYDDTWPRTGTPDRFPLESNPRPDPDLSRNELWVLRNPRVDVL